MTKQKQRLSGKGRTQPPIRRLPITVLLAIAVAGCADTYATRNEHVEPATKPVSTATTSEDHNRPKAAPRLPVAMHTDTSSAAIPPRSLRVSTNVYGATLLVRDKESGEEVRRVTLEGLPCDHEFELENDRQYVYEAQLGDESVVESTAEEDHVRLEFAADTIRELCRKAVCLIRLPEGGFGSGFLYGDRQTVVTAAHVLATKTVADVEIVFDPCEDDETTLTGAQLVYFDAKQDVAIIRLDQPVARRRPFLGRVDGSPDRLLPRHHQNIGQARESAQRGDRRAMIVIGNPGRGDGYDPLYTRNALMVAARPDEFQIDVELKPGFSGGPICLADTGQVAGIVSYKIAASPAYQEVGKSYAKSVALADDAFSHWQRLSSNSQASRMRRLNDRFARQYGVRCAVNAALGIYHDAAVYTAVCAEVVEDYRLQMDKVVRSIPPSAPRRVFQERLRKAHRHFLKERAPEKAKKVREKVSRRLRTETDKWFQEAIATETLPAEIKTDLREAYESYDTLRVAAETIVDPNASISKGKTVDEFLELAFELWSNASSAAGQVVTGAISG